MLFLETWMRKKNQKKNQVPTRNRVLKIKAKTLKEVPMTINLMKTVTSLSKMY